MGDPAVYMKIIVVDNPKSGSACPRQEIRQKCTAVGIEIERFIAIDSALARKLAPYAKKACTIAAIGGDGTISAVAGVIAHTKATLLPLPGGTLNHFTKDLGIPQDIDEALRRTATLKPRRIDIASVNDTYFINNSSLGIYPASLRIREEIEPSFGKWLAAIIAALQTLIRLKVYHVIVNDTAFKTPFIFVGNNHYSLGSPGGAQRTKLNEGILTIYIAKTQSRLTLFKIACLALIGKAKRIPEFTEIHTQTITIETNRKHISVSHDGEVSRLMMPLHYKVHAGALRVLG
jgi:diacylglycerol kinase family enzyme